MKMNTKVLVVCAMSIAMNFVGSFVAIILRLPVYLDSVGTIMSSFLFGPMAGVLTGITTSLINMIFDPVALYFMPTQIVVGILASLISKLKTGTTREKIVFNLFLSVPAAISSSLIATYLFGTMTTAGSSYIVQGLRAVGVSDFVAVFVIQIITDYFDKLVCVLLDSKIVKLNSFKNVL